jgi:hypothetical protein
MIIQIGEFKMVMTLYPHNHQVDVGLPGNGHDLVLGSALRLRLH